MIGFLRKKVVDKIEILKKICYIIKFSVLSYVLEKKNIKNNFKEKILKNIKFKYFKCKKKIRFNFKNYNLSLANAIYYYCILSENDIVQNYISDLFGDEFS